MPPQYLENLGSGDIISGGFLNQILGLAISLSWLLFFAALVIFIIFSVILSYHWKKYSFSDGTVIATGRMVYFVVSAVIFVVMASSLILIIK